MNAKNRIVLIGAGPLGMNVAHIIQKQGKYELAGFIDSKKGNVAGIEVLGDDSILDDLFRRGIRNAFVSIGNSKKRVEYSRVLKQKGFKIPALVHPSADIGLSASIGEGSVLFHNVFIGPETEIGDYCIIEAGTFIGHNAKIHDGVLLSARTVIGNSAVINEFATLKLGARCLGKLSIGVGSVVRENRILESDLAANAEY